MKIINSQCNLFTSEDSNDGDSIYTVSNSYNSGTALDSVGSVSDDSWVEFDATAVSHTIFHQQR